MVALVVRQNDVEKSASSASIMERLNIKKEGVTPIRIFYHLLRVAVTVKDVAAVLGTRRAEVIMPKMESKKNHVRPEKIRRIRNSDGTQH